MNQVVAPGVEKRFWFGNPSEGLIISNIYSVLYIGNVLMANARLLKRCT